MSEYPTIISFYTENWEYSKYANEMRKACNRLGLNHYIVEKKTTGNWLANTRLKPAFILEALNEIKGPVLWIDVDGSILHKPELLKRGYPYDFAARPMVEKKVARQWHVGTLYFDYNDLVLEFVEAWVEMQKNTDSSDELALEHLWTQSPELSGKLKAGKLPKEYFEFLKHLHYSPSPSTIVCHRGSRDETKMAMKQRNIRKYNAQ